MPVESASNDNDEKDVKKEVVPKEEGEQEDVSQNNAAAAEPKKTKYENWPLRDIKEPHENDVLYGRGGGTNHHPGNKRYREMVEDRKIDYVTSKRLDKPLVALQIIRTWREQDPPGRFLKVDEKTGLWGDVGDKKAREKTSQALREKAPLLRKQHEGAQSDDEGSDEEDDKTKTTRFAEGTNQNSNNAKKPVLARDHSLGREYIEPGAEVTLDGFSWQVPLEQVDPGRAGSQGSLPPGPYYPAGRMNSQGSIGVAHPNYHQSHGSYSYEYPDYEYRERSEGPHEQYISMGRYESWGQPVSSMGSSGTAMPPPPPMQYGAYQSQRTSGSWGSMVSGHMGSGSWGPHGPNMGREHSLSTNPLRNATTSQPAAYFDSRGGSGYWPDVPPQQPYGCPPPEMSLRYGHPPPESYRSPPDSASSLNRSPPRGAQAYTVDPTIAQTWSSQSDAQSDDYDRVVNMMGPPEVPGTWSGEDAHRKKGAHSNGAPPLRRHEGERGQLARPHIVKRATSNQNETVETKPDLKGPSVKRAALNRDNSLASNRLKATYLKDPVYKEMFDSEKELRLLPGTLERQASLKDNTARPKWLSPEDRLSTIDKIAMDLMMQSDPFELGNKRRSSSTLEALLDFDSEPLPVRTDFGRGSSASGSGEMREETITRPVPLNADARLTTVDFLEICNEVDDDDGLPTRRPELNREVSVSEWLNEDV